MLEHLHRKTNKEIVLPKESLQKLQDELLTLGGQLTSDPIVEFDFKGKTLTIRGIPEDYKVYLDGMLVCECILDQIYNLNKALAQQLL